MASRALEEIDMPILVNIYKLERGDLHVAGELPVEELGLAGVDELIRPDGFLRYDFEVQKLETAVLAHGSLELDLLCECARCLKPFKLPLKLTDWACHLPLEGEEKVSIANDCIDLTACIREDTLLEFPQHPLCKRDCRGLPKKAAGKTKISDGSGRTKESSAAWAALNKLKF